MKKCNDSVAVQQIEKGLIAFLISGSCSAVTFFESALECFDIAVAGQLRGLRDTAALPQSSVIINFCVVYINIYR